MRRDLRIARELVGLYNVLYFNKAHSELIMAVLFDRNRTQKSQSAVAAGVLFKKKWT